MTAYNLIQDGASVTHLVESRGKVSALRDDGIIWNVVKLRY